MKVRITWDKPFYVLEKKTILLGIFSYWELIEMSADFNYIEELYQDLVDDSKK